MSGLSQKYSFTLTLKPRLYQHDPYKQINLVRDELYKTLGRAGKYVLMAELTQAHNAHFHGMIQCNLRQTGGDCLRFLYNMFRKSKDIGHVNFKVVTDEPGWVEYINKAVVECLHDEYGVWKTPLVRCQAEPEHTCKVV